MMQSDHHFLALSDALIVISFSFICCSPQEQTHLANERVKYLDSSHSTVGYEYFSQASAGQNHHVVLLVFVASIEGIVCFWLSHY
jgi:hypothetical protein